MSFVLKKNTGLPIKKYIQPTKKAHMEKRVAYNGYIVAREVMSMENNENQEITWIRKIALGILGEETLKELEAWYESILRGDWKYVVFVVRKSYLLVLILEAITGKKMRQNSSTFFLTDAVLPLYVDKMAEEYRDTGKFPRIVLCDDLLIHGRNTNHLIEGIENELCNILSEYDSEQIKNALAQSLHIKVFMRIDAVTLLFGRYEFNVDYVRRERSAIWHKFSSDISMLIQRVNMANAAYIYSEHISAEQFEQIEERKEYIETKYQNIRQYTKVKYVKTENAVQAIFTLRYIQDYNKNGYRVIPFVFLPNLATDETENLMQEIFPFIDDELVRLFQSLYWIEGRRSFNELLTLYLSAVFMNDTEKKNPITIDEEEKKAERKAELIKLARNYNFYGDEETAIQMLETLLGKITLSQEKLEEILRNKIPLTRTIFTIDEENNKKQRNEIVNRLEDYFYEAGGKSEKRAKELMDMVYFETPMRSERVVSGCCFTLKELNAGYSEQDSQISMAYFLQLMDCGVVGISSFAPNKMNVVGFAQFAKAGEQSLLVMPLRYMEYIPFLVTMQKQCNRYEHETWEELARYQSSGMSDIPEKTAEQLTAFLQKLKEIGQRPAEWIENYLYRIDFENETDQGKAFHFVQKQRMHMEQYISFLNR